MDQGLCPGVYNGNGCQGPNICIPTKGPVGTNGAECPVSCPTVCPPGESTCPGGEDENGCPMPQICMNSNVFGSCDPNCFDKKGEKVCEKRKKKGKCGKKKNKKHCKLTC